MGIVTGKETNEELSKILPNIRKEFEVLSSMSFQEYEKRIEDVTGKALKELESILDDHSLALDAENLVKAVETLTKAKVNMFDSKRKLLETLLKGEIMIKALEPPKSLDNNSALEEYIMKQKQIASTSQINSVFADIEKSDG